MVTLSRPPAGELSLAQTAELTPAEALARLESGPDGLSSGEAARRLGQYGSNALGTHRVRTSAVLLRQVRNPILILLLGAALVSGLTGGGTNALIIAVIVALSVGLGFFNEYRAELAMAALRAQIRQDAEVRRDGAGGPDPGHGPGPRGPGDAAHRRSRAG
jgi:P-type Mg2+ transporter